MFGLGGKVPQMTAQQVDDRLRGDNPPYILDVRTIAEFRSGHIPGAQLIPLSDLGRRMNEIPKDREIVTVCRSGSRSTMAAKQLQKAGFTVHNMSGGMMHWTGRTVR